MVKPFSWLYGASQYPQCGYCGVMVYPDAVFPLDTVVRLHEFWCDARKAPIGVEEARAMLERVLR